MDRTDRTLMLRDLVDRVTAGPGLYPPERRSAAYNGNGLSAGDAQYVRKVCREAHRIEDEDVRALRSQGKSDDQIFEVTVAAALGESVRRLGIALAAMRKGK